MRIFIYTLMVIALGLVIYNLTQIDYKAPFSEDSIVALITVLAGLCAILLLAILLMSRKIKTALKQKL